MTQNILQEENICLDAADVELIPGGGARGLVCAWWWCWGEMGLAGRAVLVVAAHTAHGACRQRQQVGSSWPTPAAAAPLAAMRRAGATHMQRCIFWTALRKVGPRQMTLVSCSGVRAGPRVSEWVTLPTQGKGRKGGWGGVGAE